MKEVRGRACHKYPGFHAFDDGLSLAFAKGRGGLSVDTMDAARSARVLVVEDDPLVMRVIVDVLHLDGHEVDTAANGREALDRIAARSYDLILSDLMMPELDGVGFYRELVRRHSELLPRLAFVTGTTDPPELRSFIAETTVPVLLKPFDLERLRRFVRQQLG